jgi:hypothetical protein
VLNVDVVALTVTMMMMMMMTMMTAVVRITATNLHVAEHARSCITVTGSVRQNIGRRVID